MKTVLRYTKVFVLLVVAYLVFGVLTCCLPDEKIKANITRSAEFLHSEGIYPNAIINITQCRMDNFTDALIMNQIYSVDRKHPVQAAMRMTTGVLKNQGWFQKWNQTEMLYQMVNGKEMGREDYARYWHGNTMLFRPLFMIMDFNLIRLWLFAISTLLMVALTCAFYREAGLVKTLAFASGFVATCGFVTQFSMQFFPILAITLITSLLVIKGGESKDSGMLFFVVGSLSCFFDMLTTPLLTLGIPLVIMVALNNDPQLSVKDYLLKFIRLALLWGVGFALTFVSKWALGTLILGQNVFADAFNISLYRMGVEDYGRWDAVSRNFGMLNLPMILVTALSLVVLLLVRRRKFNWKKALLLLLLGVTPYIWYLVLSNHSYEHWWFTYRLQAITVMCLFFMMTDSFVKEKT